MKIREKYTALLINVIETIPTYGDIKVNNNKFFAFS